METKTGIKSLRLVLGAAKAEAEKREIAPEFVPQIEQARADLAMMRGTDVVAALVTLQRTGLGLALDVCGHTYHSRKEPERRPGR